MTNTNGNQIANRERQWIRILGNKLTWNRVEKNVSFHCNKMGWVERIKWHIVKKIKENITKGN